MAPTGSVAVRAGDPRPGARAEPHPACVPALEALADGPRTRGGHRAGARRQSQHGPAADGRARDDSATSRRDPRTKRFANVPARFYALIAAHDDHADWSEVVDPVLSELRDEFGEAAIMGVPANGTMVYLAFFPSVHLVAVRERLGHDAARCTARRWARRTSRRSRRPRAGHRAGAAHLPRRHAEGGARPHRAARAPGAGAHPRLCDRPQRDRSMARTCVAAPLRIGGIARRRDRPVGPVEPLHRRADRRDAGSAWSRSRGDSGAAPMSEIRPPRQPDHGKLIGMSVVLVRDDLETAAATVSGAGLRRHGGAREPHLRRDCPGVTVYEAHAAAAGEVDPPHRAHRLDPQCRRRRRRSTLRRARRARARRRRDGAPPALGGRHGLAAHPHLGGPRRGALRTCERACRTLAEVIERARDAVAAWPIRRRCSCELHPFTFALAAPRAARAGGGAALRRGAGICFDFCHFGVALGRDMLAAIDDDVLAAIDHVHYSRHGLRDVRAALPAGRGRARPRRHRRAPGRQARSRRAGTCSAGRRRGRAIADTDGRLPALRRAAPRLDQRARPSG